MFNDAQKFIFIQHGYDANLSPHLTLQPLNTNDFTFFNPIGKQLTINFTAATARRCIGWHNLQTSQNFPCPHNAELPEKFYQCKHCKNKTGFNPAFYNAATVSAQQQARNQQPHFLYLAHFAPGVVKVGISFCGRGKRRLLDQGARSSLIIKQYPSAVIARQHEAKIARLPNIIETLKTKTKLNFLAQKYDSTLGAAELLQARQTINLHCGIKAEQNSPEYLDNFYCQESINSPIILEDKKISGQCIGMVGSTLLFEQNNQQFALCVKDFVGYVAEIKYAEEKNIHRPLQASLF